MLSAALTLSLALVIVKALVAEAEKRVFPCATAVGPLLHLQTFADRVEFRGRVCVAERCEFDGMVAKFPNGEQEPVLWTNPRRKAGCFTTSLGEFATEGQPERVELIGTYAGVFARSMRQTLWTIERKAK